MTILLAAAILLAQSAPPDEKKIQELVDQCGSENIAEREAATRDLYALGEAALPLLEKAAKEAKGEVKARVDKVISELTLPSRWVKDAVEGDWNQVYQKLDQAIRNKELDRPQSVRVLTALLLNEAVTPEQKQGALNLMSTHRIREMWPSILQLMAREDSSTDYGYGHYLQRLRPPKEAAGAILKMIPKMQNTSQAWQLLELARSLKPERVLFEECLTAIMEGDDVNLKNNAMSWLQQGRLAVSTKTLLKWWRDHPAMRQYQLREAVLRTPPGDGSDEVVGLLKSNQADDTSLAIEYIGRQRVASAAGALAKAMEDRPDLKAQILQAFRTLRCDDEVRKWIAAGPSRRQAIALAAELGWTTAGPEIRGAMSDGDAAVRREAVGAAGALRLTEASDKLEELLRDGDGGVRRAALVSFALIRRHDATKAVLTHLRSDDPDLQAAAVEALPYVDAEQALAALTSDEALSRGITRHALAVLIVKGGTSMLHRVMARVHGKITPDEMHSHIRLVQTSMGR